MNAHPPYPVAAGYLGYQHEMSGRRQIRTRWRVIGRGLGTYVATRFPQLGEGSGYRTIGGDHRRVAEYPHELGFSAPQMR
jgi:hypothetical protein